MKKLTAATGAGITVVALSLALAGCGSDSKTETSTSSAASSSGASSSESSAAPSTAPAGPQKTISDYITENKIVEQTVKRGEAGPNINVPQPPDWQAKAGDLPKGTYAMIVDTKTAVPNNPPRILALLSRLSANADPAELLKYAPGELQNLPGFVETGQPQTTKLSGFDAVQLMGDYADGDKKGVVAQKTVVIPMNQNVYVLQFNGFADQSEVGALTDAMNIIDQQTKITA
jgi:hypothetical protein